MKQLLRSLAITACVAFSFAGAQAQVITAERAQEIANSFFSNGKQKSAAVRSTAAVSMKKSADSRILTSESSSDAPTFHIITPASGEGFVIVSGEEIENPIIGYSFEGTIDTNDLPVGFVDYITDIDAQVKTLRKYNANNPQKAAAARSAMQKTNYNATTMGNKVYLETASWGQEYPFNAQCFTSYNGSTNALTGCVPTAYAIIMRYHEWPQVGTGTLYNCQAPTYVEITDRTYDYSKMPLVYDGNWSTEQINEVAKLMSHLGHSFMVSYGSSQTSVSDPSNTDKPNKFFNYNLVYASYQANFTMDSWEEKIKESIDNGCPIPYASDNAGTGDTRHMFVLDGYTANDYFHFNFGWKGNSNGWFKLDAITPSQGDNYSWQNGADHYAIFNFTPNKTKYAVNASVSPENAGMVSINGSAAASSATGEYLQGATVTLAATANTGYTFQNWTKGSEVVSTNKSCTVKVASSDNDYVANFLTVGNTTVNVSVTYNSSYGTVTGTSGTVANGTTLTPRLNEEVTLTATPADGYIFTGWTVTKGTESTNYSGTSLTFVATGEMSVTANFALAVQDYVVTASTLDKSGKMEGSTTYCSTYTFNNGPAFTLTTTKDGEEAYALTQSDTNIDFYATATTKSSTSRSTNITYTLTAPPNYLITKYSFELKSSSSSYTIIVDNGNTTTIDNSGYKEISGTNPGTKSVTFTLSSDYTRGSAKAYVQNFTVTLMKDDGTGSGSTPTPTQYTITATANPGTAGSVTGGGTYNEGATVTLTANANNGYNFTGWYNGQDLVSNENPYTFIATASGTYEARFEEEATIPAVDLSGKWFRLNSNNRYMHVKGHTQSEDNATCGSVNVVTSKTVNSNDEVFLFEKSGDGYKLKTRDGYYITCAEWNVDAYSTHEANGSVLLFEEDGGIYRIKWYNTFKTPNAWLYFKVGPDSNGAGDHPYGDAEYTAAATWVLEEVTLHDVTVTAAGTDGSAAVAVATGTATDKAEHGTSVTLTANANNSYNFTGWYNGEDLVTDANPYTFVLEGNISYEARFEVAAPVTYTISVSADPGTAGTASIGTETSTTVTAGEQVTLTAVPNSGYNFAGWYKGETKVSDATSYTFVPTESANYVARFEEEAAVGGGSDTVYNIVTNNTTGIVSETSGTLSKVWTYSGSPEITITSSDYTISNREAAINLRAANYTITVPDVFEIVSYTINFKTSYEATITAGTTSESYTTASSLTFNAENINAESATFSLSMANGRNIQVTSIDMVLRATGYTIRVVAGEGGNAYIGKNATDVATEATITAGEEVTLRAEVTEGYEFDGWYDSNGKFISDEPTYTLTPDDNMTYTAKFYALVEANKYYKLQCQGSNKYYLSSNINSADNNRLMMNGANRIFYYGSLINEFNDIDDDIEANQKKLLAYTEGNFVGIEKRATGDYYDVTLLDNHNEISHNVKFNVGTNGNVMISVEYVEEVDGKYISTYFHLDGNGTSVGSNTNYINDNSHNWMYEEVTSLPVEIQDVQHTTLFAPVALEIPDGVRAYVLDASNIDGTSKDIVLTRLNSIIPANTGVILKGNAGIYNFNITTSTDEANAEAAGNALAGTVARTRVVGDAYILAVREGKVGLYPLAGNSYLNPDVQTSSFTNGSHKAYLPVKDDTLGEILKKSTGVRFLYSDEIVTGIQEGILYDGAEGESIYDLQGRKLSEITEPGIYIVNGKKTFIK